MRETKQRTVTATFTPNTGGYGQQAQSNWEFEVDGYPVKRIPDSNSGGWRFVGTTYDGRIFKADVPAKSYEGQTEAELDFYTGQLNSEDEKYFPKILDFGTWNNGDQQMFWMIQEKVEIVKRVHIKEETIDMLDELCARYGISDLNYEHLVEDFSDYARNWTLAPNLVDPMIYDFGVGPIIKF